MARTTRKTAKKASSLLRNSRSKKIKSVAASALRQRRRR